MGVLTDVLVLSAPRHSHQNMIDEIEASRPADVPLKRRQQQQFPTLYDRKGKRANNFFY